MFPIEILLANLVAVLLVVIASGPDNILTINRGLSQERIAAVLSFVGAGLGIMCILWLPRWGSVPSAPMRASA